MLENNFSKGIFLYIFCCLAILLYSLFLRYVGHFFFEEQAKGSLIYDDQGKIRGSYLLYQEYPYDSFFVGRINQKFSSGCDVALYSDALKKTLNSRYEQASSTPHDVIMITPSGSLLDPYITKQEALRQAKTIAVNRNLKESDIVAIITQNSIDRSFPFFELDIVNTNLLNDKITNLLRVQ